MLKFSISINDMNKEMLIRSTMKKYHFNDTDEKLISEIYLSLAT